MLQDSAKSPLGRYGKNTSEFFEAPTNFQERGVLVRCSVGKVLCVAACACSEHCARLGAGLKLQASPTMQP